MPPADAAIEVTLRSIDGMDEFPERKFVLNPHTTVPIGRSSKNTTKKLMSGADNAFIDSPVISREHALLSASNTLGVPTVFITDNGSMHGTYVNSHPLGRNLGHQLHNGDTLQFGQNVVRDQDSFIAKKYRFQSQIAPSVSRGFSVPDADTEEEEEVEEEESLRVARYGTLNNPVNVDDYEDYPHVVLDLEHEVVGFVTAPPKINQPVAERADSPAFVPRSLFTEATSSQESEAAEKPTVSEAQAPLVEDDVSEAENEDHLDEYDASEEERIVPFDLLPESDASADDDEEEASDADSDAQSESDENISAESNAGSMSESDSGSDSEQEDAEDADAVRRRKMKTMLDFQKAVSDEQPSAPAQSSPYTVQAASKYHESLFQPGPPLDFNNPHSSRDVDNIANGAPNHTFGGSFSEWGMVSSPLARPAAPKPSIWDTLPTDSHNSFARDGFPHSNPWSFDPSPAPAFAHMPSSDFRATRMDYLGQVLNSEPAPASAPAPALGIPTPPMPVSDEVIPMTSQPNHRTKVSIPELVEDTPQQPPTPTSVGSPRNMKRKAEVLEEEEAEKTEAPQPATVEVATTEAAPAAAEEPPAKRRRTILGSLAGNAVSFIAGSAFAVGALLYLPDVVYA